MAVAIRTSMLIYVEHLQLRRGTGSIRSVDEGKERGYRCVAVVGRRGAHPIFAWIGVEPNAHDRMDKSAYTKNRV
eukprot:scaffold499_cov335-Pavlova_lutheri.AAC.6